MNSQAAEVRIILLRTWAGVDPEQALAAWRKWEGPKPESDAKVPCQLIPQEIYEDLASLPEAGVLAFLAKHPEPVDSATGLETLIASRPDRWLPLASDPQASPTLKKEQRSLPRLGPPVIVLTSWWNW